MSMQQFIRDTIRRCHDATGRVSSEADILLKRWVRRASVFATSIATAFTMQLYQLRSECRTTLDNIRSTATRCWKTIAWKSRSLLTDFVLYLRRRHVLATLDGLDAAAVLISRLVMAPHLALRPRLLYTTTFMLSLLLIAHALALYSEATALWALVLFALMLGITCSAVRMVTVLDSSMSTALTEDSESFRAVTRRMPDIDLQAKVIAASTALGIHAALLGANRIGFVDLHDNGADLGIVESAVFVTDQAFRALLLDVPEVYDLSISQLRANSLTERHITFGIRTFFSLALLSLLYRLSPWSGHKAVEQAAIANLVREPNSAIALGERMLRPLTRFRHSQPRTAHYSEFIARDMALIATAGIAGNKVLSKLQRSAQSGLRASVVTECLIEIGTLESLDALLDYDPAWTDKDALSGKSIQTMYSDALSSRLLNYGDDLRSPRGLELVPRLLTRARAWHVSSDAKIPLLCLIGMGLSRFDVRPFTTEDPCEWQAAEVGYSKYFIRSTGEHHPIDMPDAREYFRDIVTDPDSEGIEQFLALCVLDWIGSPSDAHRFRQLLTPDVAPHYRIRGILGYGRCDAGTFDVRLIMQLLPSATEETEKFVLAAILLRSQEPAAVDLLFDVAEQRAWDDGCPDSVRQLLVRGLTEQSKAQRTRLLTSVVDNKCYPNWHPAVVQAVLSREPELVVPFSELLRHQDVRVCGTAAAAAASLNTLDSSALALLQHAAEGTLRRCINEGMTGSQDSDRANSLWQLIRFYETTTPQADTLPSLQVLKQWVDGNRSENERADSGRGLPVIEIGPHGRRDRWEGFLSGVGIDDAWRLRLFRRGEYWY